jgi:RimJ/RimL family protein N-acetyltransferase
MTTNLEIREVEAEDLATFKEVRLEALLNHPEVFASVYEEEMNDSDEKWLARIAAADGRSSITYLAYVDGQPAGMAGIFCGFSPKNKHSGTIWGVYIRPKYRGQGIATRLLEACASWAREGAMRVLKLNVVTTNTAAIKCYSNYGFQVYGLEPKALFVDNRYYDELLMVKTI